VGVEVGTLYVRRSIFIDASPERVWEEFADAGTIATWLGIGHELHRFELKVGGVVDMSIDAGDGRRAHYGGKVVVLDPSREVTFESNWSDEDRRWPVPTLWTIRLTALYGGTLAELFHHGFERLGTAAGDELEGYEQGWDVKHLKALRRQAQRP
jgi:uncharacterized protein YndB with AHSA1/START domain